MGVIRIVVSFSQIREVHDVVVPEHRGAECLGDLGNIVTAPKEATLRQGHDVFHEASAYAQDIPRKMAHSS
jgi:hypothetical protein